MPCPRTLSEPLLQALDKTLGFSDGPAVEGALPRLCEGVHRLSQLFTRGRGDLENPYLDDAGQRQAYAAYFLPVNLAKVQCLLEEMPASTFGLSASQAIRVLDLGGGPGTAALAVLDWLKRHPSLGSRPLEVLSLDRSGQALTDAKALWQDYGRLASVEGARLVTVEADLERGLGRSIGKTLGERDPQAIFNVIVLANSLNEVFKDDPEAPRKRLELIRDCASWLAPSGTLMIIEPALRETARSLHELRNEVLGQPNPSLHVYSPCLHEKPCPALVKETDWCHEERPWSPPAMVTAIDREVGFIKDALKFSYLLLRKDDGHIAPDAPDIYRVVSELRVMKGEKRAWLCNQTGRPEVGRQDRLQSPINAAFDDWHRGDIVRIDQIVRKEKHGRESALGRIPAEAKVEILRPI